MNSSMSKWPKYRIKDVCSVTSSTRIRSSEYQDDGVPFYRGKEIIEKQRGALKVSTDIYIPRERFEEVKRKGGAPKLGELLLTSVGTLGVPYVVRKGEEFYFKDGNLTWFRAFQGLHGKYLYYWLLSPLGKAELKKCVIGSSQPAYTIVLLKEMEIDCPPLQIQHQITEILSAYDDLIENNTRRIEILEEMARRLYEEWFVQFRFPGYEGVKFKESELGIIPEGWSIVKLEEICDLITDGAHKSPPTAEIGMPMASVKDMHDWGIDVSKCRKISQPDYDELVRNNCKPMVGDVLVAKDGSYLKHIFSVEKDQDLVLLSSIAILRPINKSVSDLLVCLLRHPETIARMKGCVSGVAIPRIILKDFRKFQVVLPSQDLQEAWLATASPLMRLCRKLVDKNANLRAQRDLLLPKLISGEIDVSDIPMPT